MDSSSIIKRSRERALYAFYKTKLATQPEQPYGPTYDVLLDRIMGGMPMYYNGIMTDIPCSSSAECQQLVTINNVHYSLDEAVISAFESVLNYAATTGMGPTKSSRLFYLWFMTVTSGYNWITSSGRITGTIDNWNWDIHNVLTSDTDIFVFMNHLLIDLMPTIIPGYNTSALNSQELAYLNWTPEQQAIELARIRAEGDWNGWLSAWNTWWSYRSADGNIAAAAVPPDSSLPNGSQTLNVATTTDDPNTFTDPYSWLPLIVNNVKKNYLTYNWNDIISTGLSAGDETTIKAAAQALYPGNAVSYNDNSARANEIAALIAINGTLTDDQKMIAEFWAGGPGTASPPGMLMWFWKEYMITTNIAHVRGFSTFFFSGLELAINLFEAGRLVWGLKKANMQARPIQEIRRMYRGQTLTGFDSLPILGEAWIPYQEANFVTPPFADFPSGHTAYSQVFANVMTAWFGSTISATDIRTLSDLYILSPILDTQMQQFGKFTIKSGSSDIQPNTVPSNIINLSWSSWQEMADSAGISRQYGGIHCASAHNGSQTLANALTPALRTIWNINYT